MAIFDGLRRRLDRNKRSTKQEAGNMIGYFGVGSGESKQYNYGDLASEGYLKNAIVYRCVNEISKGAGSVRYMIKNGDTSASVLPSSEKWMGVTYSEDKPEVMAEFRRLLTLEFIQIICGNRYF